MKNGFRQVAAWLHTWSGLTVGWVLFFVFVTGTAGYFQHEITRWMQPELPYAAPLPTGEAAAVADRAAAHLLAHAPQATRWTISMPQYSPVSRAWEGLSVRWDDMHGPGMRRAPAGRARLDAATGAELPPAAAPRATGGGAALYRLHYELYYLPKIWGIRLVGACSMLMLLAIVTGIITHKKIFRDFFTFRPGKGQRSWLDAHNAVSVMALPFFLMITYSGLVFFMYEYMPLGAKAVFGGDAGEDAYYAELWGPPGPPREALALSALPLGPMVQRAEAAWGAGQVGAITVERPAGGGAEVTLARVQGGGILFWGVDKLRFDAHGGAPLAPEPVYGGAPGQTQKALINLHEGLFAGPVGRWLYFASGLLGCAMIGTGLVMWTVKRRRHHLGSGRESAERFGLRLVEGLNVATLAGLPLALAAYFWANRLLPLDLAARAGWEMHTLFAVWLSSAFYGLARPTGRAWVELLWACAAAYALVPVLNALTTEQHLWNTLARGDWARAGFDLTMASLAAVFAMLAHRVGHKLRAKPAAPSRRQRNAP
ncbi:PepSY-associated TM helix domain-containing protein [Achromobacter veterisilvae]|uniref:PepSY-associated TM helix domain-containing protein n=1 Tax=Achromobacter veterisilvae TaxID=2069367 RepID=A0ABZ2S174_9BURK